MFLAKFLMVSVLFSNSSQTLKSWVDIVPLTTTRTEVECLLGKPSSGEGSIVSYETTNELITVWYNGLKLAKDSRCRWELPPDRVVNFVVTPKIDRLVSDVPFDLSTFTKERDLHRGDGYYYFNESKGVTIAGTETDGKQLLESIRVDLSKEARRKYCAPG